MNIKMLFYKKIRLKITSAALILLLSITNVWAAELIAAKDDISIKTSTLSPQLNLEGLSTALYFSNNITSIDIEKAEPGVLDGLTIVRFAHSYSSTGGLQQYLKDLNRSLLKRNKVTIIQVYITQSYDDINKTRKPMQIGKGTLIEIPVLAKYAAREKEDTSEEQVKENIEQENEKAKTSNFSSSLFNAAKYILEVLRVKQYISYWMRFSFVGPILKDLPGFKEFYINDEKESNVEEVGKTISKVLDTYKADFVMVHSLWLADNLAVAEQAKKRGVPILAQHHGDNALLKDLRMDQVISDSMAVGGVNNLDVPKKVKAGFKNLGDGIDVDFFRLSEASLASSNNKRPILLLPARVDRGKGHLDVIKIVKLLKAKDLNPKVVFAGPYEQGSEFKEEVDNAIEQAGLEDDIIFVGSLSQKALRDYYSASDIVILPTKSEGLGRILLEAQAMETPVVAYDTGGVANGLVDNQTGYLAKKNDVADFADKLELLLSNKQKRQIMGKMGRQFVENFYSFEALAKRHEDFYIKNLANFDKQKYGSRIARLLAVNYDVKSALRLEDLPKAPLSRFNFLSPQPQSISRINENIRSEALILQAI